MAKDPVGGMAVDETTAQFTSVHEGERFYFCASHCESTFDRDPHRYGHQA